MAQRLRVHPRSEE